MLIAAAVCLAVCSGCCAQEALPADGEVVCFQDALGRTVTVPKEPKRVAALLGSFADLWMLSGGTLCAAAEDAWDDFGLDLPKAVNLGGAHSPSLEALLAAAPDFVIASASTASNVEMKDTLENAGITVAYFDVDCFEDYLAMLDICTDITAEKTCTRKTALRCDSRLKAQKRRSPGQICRNRSAKCFCCVLPQVL